MLSDDIRWYETARRWISERYRGLWVVVKNRSIRGAYPTFAQAQAAAAAMGLEQPLIKQATWDQVSQYNPTPFTLRGRRLGQYSQASEQLRQSGAIVQVTIAPPEGGTPQTVSMMIDSGASISTISGPVATAAGLVQSGSIPLFGVGGGGEQPVYTAVLEIPAYGVKIGPMEIAGTSLPMPDVQGLVGRDVLRALEFAYHGGQGGFDLSEEAGGGPGAPAAPGGPVARPRQAGEWIPVAGGIVAATALVLAAARVL